MKYLDNFILYNEGLFTDVHSDNDIASAIYNKLSSLIRFYVISKRNNYLIIENIKLDKNPGSYNIYSSKENLEIEYFKKDKLVFKYEVKCTNLLKESIFNLIKKYYLG